MADTKILFSLAFLDMVIWSHATGSSVSRSARSPTQPIHAKSDHPLRRRTTEIGDGAEAGAYDLCQHNASEADDGNVLGNANSAPTDHAGGRQHAYCERRRETARSRLHSPYAILVAIAGGLPQVRIERHVIQRMHFPVFVEAPRRR